jgi:hypothetical protein
MTKLPKEKHFVLMYGIRQTIILKDILWKIVGFSRGFGILLKGILQEILRFLANMWVLY